MPRIPLRLESAMTWSRPVRISANRCCVMSVALNRWERPLSWLMPMHWQPQPLQGQRLLLAIGGRHLPALTAAVCRAGAIPYGRALPSPDGVRAALRAGLPPDHLAVVRPLQGEVPGAIERSLCRRWGIGVVLCRQSGGVTEQLWHQLTTDLGLSLLLLRRPFPRRDGMRRGCQQPDGSA